MSHKDVITTTQVETLQTLTRSSALSEAQSKALHAVLAFITTSAGREAVRTSGDHMVVAERQAFDEALALIGKGEGASTADLAAIWSAGVSYATQPARHAAEGDSSLAQVSRFAGLVLKEHRNDGYPGDVDGDVIQAYAEQCGLIEEKHMDRPCAENCSCTDFGEFPTKCFFYTDLGKRLIDLTRGGEQT